MAAINEWFGLYNIIYSFVEQNYGYGELTEYWKNTAKTVYAKLAEDFKKQGLPYIKTYFEETFAKDEGSASGSIDADGVTISITESPDVKWTQAYEYDSFKLKPWYFDHYKYIYGQVAEMAGMDFEMIAQPPDGKCVFRFSRRRGQSA